MTYPTLTQSEFESVHLFRGVDHTAIEHLLEECFFHQLEAEETLIAPESDNTHVYVILSGILRIHLIAPTSPAIAHLTVGACVGEMSMIDNEEASAYVIANSRSRLLVIPRTTIWRMIAVSHYIARNLLYVLSRRVRSTNEIVTESIKRETLLEQYAMVDSLTSLYNRRWLDEYLVRMMLRCHRSQQYLSLILIDIDRFKQYNDTQGHLGGDCALSALAKMMSRHLRPGDAAARYGGEEMVVILPGADLAEGRNIAERLRLAVQNMVITMADGAGLPSITISLGLAIMSPGSDITPMQLLASADQALYQAKHEGRNRVCVSASCPPSPLVGEGVGG
ncbi:MAG: GGDEF domain-containing protein [Magnetococcales bacterium]|nr:GGDEF domain-containing protein [Magnetococcales bacterium]